MKNSNLFIRKTVFASKSEHYLYKALNTMWSNSFLLFPSLPFATVFNFEKMDLTKGEKEFLFKTSIDFTLCDKKTGAPVLSIEFDGMGRGFSRNGEYIEISPSDDKYRKLKFDLKLKISTQTGYPYFIVSYKETENLEPGLNLTIVDGIIGKVLAWKHASKTIQERAWELDETLSDLPSDLEREVISDWIVEKEVEGVFLWDPIVKKIGEYESKLPEKLRSIGKDKILKCKKYIPLSETSIPIPLDRFDQTTESGVRELEKPFWIGYKVIIETNFGNIEKSVLIRNIGFFSASLSKDIAELLALKELVQFCEV